MFPEETKQERSTHPAFVQNVLHVEIYDEADKTIFPKQHQKRERGLK